MGKLATKPSITDLVIAAKLQQGPKCGIAKLLTQLDDDDLAEGVSRIAALVRA